MKLISDLKTFILWFSVGPNITIITIINYYFFYHYHFYYYYHFHHLVHCWSGSGIQYLQCISLQLLSTST